MPETYFRKGEIIPPAISINSICSSFERTCDKDFYFNGEFHPFWEFVFVTRGCVGVSGDDRVYKLPENSIIFHKPMEFHKIWALENDNSKFFVMSFHASGTHLKKLENLVVSLNDTQKSKIINLIYYLKKNFEIADDGNFFVSSPNISSEVFQSITNLMEAFLLSILTHPSLETVHCDSSEEIQLYSEILQCLIKNVYSNLSLDDIASICATSKSQLKRCFSKISEIGIHKYFIKLKIAEAIDLFYKGMSVGEVSEKLSFSSPNYFCMAFKREIGLSPSEFKKRI